MCNFMCGECDCLGYWPESDRAKWPGNESDPSPDDPGRGSFRLRAVRRYMRLRIAVRPSSSCDN